MRAMSLRVIQWATGNVGRNAVEGIVSHPDLDLVGAYTYDPAKAGRDVGELCGIAPLGVTATSDVDEVLAIDADCVVYAPMLPNTEEVLPVISFNAKASAEDANKHADFVARMLEKGYTAKQVRLLCEWYLRVRKSS